MFNLLVTYLIENKKREEFLDALSLAGVIEKTHAEPGCIKYEIYLPIADKNKVLLMEQWESESSQKAHMLGEHIKSLAEIKKEFVLETEIKSFELTDK